MSVTNVVEDIGSRTGDIDWQYERSYKRIFKVMCNSDNDDASVVNFAVDPVTLLAIPSITNSYPTDPLCLVSKISSTKMSGQPRLWQVTVDYSSTFSLDPFAQTANPLSLPPVVEYDWEKCEKFVREDVNAVAIVNSAGTPYDPPLSINYGVKIITIEKNYASLPFASVLDLSERVNSDAWTDPNGITYPASTLVIRGVKSKKHWSSNQSIHTCNWTIAYRPIEYDGWLLTAVADSGFYEKLADGTVRLIRDKFGAPMPQMTMLKNGLKKLEADPVQYRLFQLRKTVAYTGLI